MISALDRSLFRRWIRASWAGWLLGIPCLIALALIGEALGIGGAQVSVGAGVGAGVGFVQGRALREVLPPGHWFWSCAGGLGLAFLLQDVVRLAEWGSFPLKATVAIGGLLTGIWQAVLLQERFRSAAWWVVASLAGWTLAGASATLADTMFQSRRVSGIPGALAYLGLVAIGGLVLGLVTGPALIHIVRRERGLPAA